MTDYRIYRTIAGKPEFLGSVHERAEVQAVVALVDDEGVYLFPLQVPAVETADLWPAAVPFEMLAKEWRLARYSGPRMRIRPNVLFAGLAADATDNKEVACYNRPPHEAIGFCDLLDRKETKFGARVKLRIYQPKGPILGWAPGDVVELWCHDGLGHNGRYNLGPPEVP